MSLRQFCIAAAMLAATSAIIVKAAPAGSGVTSGPIAMNDALSNIWGLSVVSDGNGGWRLSTLSPPATAYSYLATVSANDVNVSAAPVTVFSVTACNNVAAMRFVRLYNLATAPSGATTSAIAWRGSLPSNGGCVTLYSNPNGVTFSTGLAFDITTASADADQTATTAADVSLNIGYR